MLKSPRLLQLLRQAPAQEGFLRASLRRDFTGLVSRPQTKTGSIQRRDFATAKLRTARPSHLCKAWRRQTRQNSSNASGKEPGGPEPQSLSERMKAMSRKYGWTVVGIYLGLSALDFPFCFLAVRWLGTDRIAAAEHAIVSRFWAALESVVPSLKERRAINEAAEAEDAVREAGEAVAKDAKHEPASEYYCIQCIDAERVDADRISRYLDTTSPRVWSAQVTLLPPSSSHISCDAQGGKDAARMGLEDWQAQAHVDAAKDGRWDTTVEYRCCVRRWTRPSTPTDGNVATMYRYGCSEIVGRA